MELQVENEEISNTQYNIQVITNSEEASTATTPASLSCWQNPQYSPHVAQVFLNQAKNVSGDGDGDGDGDNIARTMNMTMLPFVRVLDHSSMPHLEYRRRKDERKTVIHWGQRKLLIAEIEFLTQFVDDLGILNHKGHTFHRGETKDKNLRLSSWKERRNIIPKHKKKRRRKNNKSHETNHDNINVEEEEDLHSIASVVDVGGSGDGTYDVIVIYVGAAPGTHIAYLATLFPTVKFCLIDPAPFSDSILTMIESSASQIQVIQQLFTDHTAVALREAIRCGDDSNRVMLFISDVRTADPLIMSPEEVELRYCCCHPSSS